MPKFPRGAAYGITEERFGGPLAHIEEDVTVGTSYVVCAQSSPDRVSLQIVNLSDTEMFVAPSRQVSSTHGIRIGPSGGGISLDIYEDGILPALEWCAISTQAAKEMYVLSCVRVRSTEGG